MSIGPDQIEAAAVAIWRTFTLRNARGKGDEDWARIPQVQKEHYRREAAAALQAAATVGGPG